MAEALTNYRYGDRWRAVSAGTRPAGFVHPLAIAVLREIGIDASAARSKAAGEFDGREFDLVVTVCDSAAEECPAWLGTGRRIHRSFPDPARASGSADEVLHAFRNVRDALDAELTRLLSPCDVTTLRRDSS